MELMPGYKQTEVGVIPEEWEVTGLQQACQETITYGIVQCGPHIRDGVPYIRVSDMSQPELKVDEMLRTSKSIASRFSRSTVTEGDLVYALRGRLGEVRQVRAELAGANLTQGTARLSPNDRIVSDYLVWAMRDPRVIKQASLEAKGTTFREITLTDLRRIKVLLPPKEEQSGIAKALSNIDALLYSLDSYIAKKRNLKQAAMQQLLTGNIRLPGFHIKWQSKHLSELIVPQKKTSRPSSEGKFFGAYPFFTNTTKPVDRFIDNCDFDTEAIIANTGGEAYFNYYNGGFAAMADCFVFKTSLAAKYLYYFLKLNQQAININGFTGSGIKHLDKKFFAKLVVPYPIESAEQNAIAEVLTVIDSELTALEKQRMKITVLKEGMMQELLTGRTRLI